MAQAPAPKPRKPAAPKRPAHLPHGRWLGDLEKEQPLSAAEKALVRACAEGLAWSPAGWDGKSRPEQGDSTNTIRGELIRFLALSGDALHPVHEDGVMACGAWISGALDLHQALAAVRIDMRFCHFEAEPGFMAAHLPELGLGGSAVPGIQADRLSVAGGVFLGNGFKASGTVRLLGAEIGGNLQCGQSSFTNEGGDALAFDSIRVKGNVFLHDGFKATGTVRLVSAQIGGDLTCSNGKFINMSGDALHADRINVKGSIFLRKATVDGAILMSTAKLGTLNDDHASWSAGGHILDGLQYDRIIGPTDAASRIAWLRSQRADQLTTDFKPQPWEQLIKVLREMGHPYEAGEIAIAKQDQMRVAGVIKGPVRKRMHWLYGKMAGYGHRPIRTVGWMAVVWFLMSVAFWVGADQFAAIGPSNPAITSEALYPDAGKLCGHGNELAKEPGKARWTECPGVPDEYSTFQPFIYSLDLILPLVDLQQDSDWAPIAEGPTGKDLPAGVILRWLMWFEILFGWAASLMLVAVLGRLVEKD